MTVRVAAFAGEFAALGAWTGEPEDQLRGEEDYHEADREHWLAWDGERVAGVLHPWRSPDGKQRLYFGRCRADTYGPLAAVIDGECYTQVDAGDEAALGALGAAGFAEARAEHEYTVPVRRLDAAPTAGLAIIPADQTELEPLMLLDCAIRADIPGAEGWQPDPVWFREETYDSPFFDPQTYRVALDGERYVGLARVWRPVTGRDPMPVLGCVGVLAAYRQRGLARALIGAAFEPLAERGVAAVKAEVDTANVASNALFASLGATVTGGTIELRRG
jgi:ribosomal protein S18 acetylase RimI-like enzyme